jgi:DNA-binding transcriptional MocR family regulator
MDMSNKNRLVDRIGQFTTVPNTVIKMWNQIGMDAFALFVYLRYRTDEHDECYPSYDTIQKDTGLRWARISAAVAKLEEAGLLERRKRFGNSTVYTLVMPPISPPVELLEESPVVHLSNYSSPPVELSVVRQEDTNQIHLTRSNEQDKPSSPDGEKRRNGHSFWKEDILRLANIFSQERGVPVPAPKTASECKQVNMFWANPLKSLLAICEGDEARASRLIQLSVQHMEKEHLTCASPKQIVIVAGSVFADLKKGKLAEKGLTLTPEEKVAQFLGSFKPMMQEDV